MMRNPMDNHYPYLIQQFCRSLRSFRNEKELLDNSISFFTHIINNPREESCIQTLEQLIIILEHRDELSSTEVSILKSWANALSHVTTRCIVEQYEKLLGQPKTPQCSVCNIIVEHNLNLPKPKEPEVKREPEIKESHTVSSDDLEDAFDAIVNQLGRAWKDLARQFKISEYEIEDVENRSRRMVDRAYDIFTLWREKAGKDAKTSKLIVALGKCRRKDLADKLLDHDY